MLKRVWFNLQMFADGGDGGDGGTAGAFGESGAENQSGEDVVKASIPEKAKKYYEKAVGKQEKKSKPTANDASTVEKQTTAEERIPYAELIKSDGYKEEHQAYMEKTIGERLKKFKGMEDTLGKHREVLEVVAGKYGIDPSAENFLEVLDKKIREDDSYYEAYAMEHEVTTDEARKIVTMERKVAKMEAEKKEREQREAMQRQVMILRQNAEKTKAQFPQFDLDAEMQDERFRKLCAVNNGDTTAAYMACHWQDVIPATVKVASERIQAQTAQAIASNRARPMENGLNAVAPAVVKEDFSSMNLQQLRNWAAEQRRKNGR